MEQKTGKYVIYLSILIAAIVGFIGSFLFVNCQNVFSGLIGISSALSYGIELVITVVAIIKFHIQEKREAKEKVAL